jgi:hypothetical protein
LLTAVLESESGYEAGRLRSRLITVDGSLLLLVKAEGSTANRRIERKGWTELNAEAQKGGGRGMLSRVSMLSYFCDLDTSARRGGSERTG